MCWGPQVGRECDGNIGEAVEQEEKLCDEVKETVREFSYLGDGVSTSGRCEVAVSTRRRCGWVELFDNVMS